MSASQILVVDDDPIQRSDIAEMVASCGFQVTTAADGREALAKIAASPVSAILTDLVMPRMDGGALLKELAARGDRTPTIVLTAAGSVDQAISFVHDLKAFWFLDKPVQPGVLRTLLERALEQHHLLAETERLHRQLSYQGVLGELIGDSPCMHEIFSLIRQVAPTTASVLITGESGTGKELVARAVHSLSPRSAGPFVAINCAALPESLMESELFGHEKGAFTGAVERRAGCFEQAQNGTLLLDEIGEMPLATQAKLLRVIEDCKVRRLGGASDIPISVRVLAATNRDPLKAIENKHLREDLYYRLNVFHIALPPLRERKQDIPLLVGHFLERLSRASGRTLGVSDEALRLMLQYDWPGNVREMENSLERASAMSSGPLLHSADLPSPLQNSAQEQMQQNRPAANRIVPISELERRAILEALARLNGDKLEAARLLGIGKTTLYRKLKEYRLAEFGEAPRDA